MPLRKESQSSLQNSRALVTVYSKRGGGVQHIPHLTFAMVLRTHHRPMSAAPVHKQKSTKSYHNPL